MAWIETDHENDRVAEVLAQATPKGAQVDAILSIHGPNVQGLEAHLALYRSAMRPTAELGALEREMIAVVVSSLNGCRY